jgi:hypothetical protein
MPDCIPRLLGVESAFPSSLSALLPFLAKALCFWDFWLSQWQCGAGVGHVEALRHAGNSLLALIFCLQSAGNIVGHRWLSLFQIRSSL